MAEKEWVESRDLLGFHSEQLRESSTVAIYKHGEDQGEAMSWEKWGQTRILLGHLKLRPVWQTNGNIAGSSIYDSVVQGKSGDVSINLPVTVIQMAFKARALYGIL